VTQLTRLRQSCGLDTRWSGGSAAGRRSVGRSGPVQGQSCVIALGQRCGNCRSDTNRGNRQGQGAEHREQCDAQIMLRALHVTTCAVGWLVVHGTHAMVSAVCACANDVRCRVPRGQQDCRSREDGRVEKQPRHSHRHEERSDLRHERRVA
jgi:hypothetical protein